MPSLFLSPHNDDESLYGAYTLLREKPFVLICLRSRKQDVYGITAEQREAETEQAMKILGCKWGYADYVWDVDPDWYHLEEMLWSAKRSGEFDRVYAPANEGQNGNDQHRIVGEIADVIWPDMVTHYLTYTWPEGKSRDGKTVEHTFYDEHVKMEALACYQSQIHLPSTAPHFQTDLEEYYESS